MWVNSNNAPPQFSRFYQLILLNINRCLISNKDGLEITRFLARNF